MPRIGDLEEYGVGFFRTFNGGKIFTPAMAARPEIFNSFATDTRAARTNGVERNADTSVESLQRYTLLTLIPFALGIRCMKERSEWDVARIVITKKIEIQNFVHVNPVLDWNRNIRARSYCEG